MIQKIIEKLFSGKYFVVVSIVTTYCVSTTACLYLVGKGKMSLEVFLGIFSGFSALAGQIVNAYFNKDRNVPKP